MNTTWAQMDEVVSGPVATFNVYVGGHTLTISLNPGESVTFEDGGPSEEGFYRSIDVFTHEGEFIRCEVSNSWRDCDGPGGDSTDLTCRVDQLDAYESASEDKALMPRWERVSGRQYDAYAEAAGY